MRGTVQCAGISPIHSTPESRMGSIRVQAFGDRMADDGLTFLFEQGDELLLLLNQRINLRRLIVEELGDLGLLFDGWERDA